MPVSVSIEPLTPSIDMYDSPDTFSAYSLSGHITITVTPSTSILGLSRPLPQNLLLSSLELTFEGQSELVLNEIGYSPLRIISISKELVSSSHPVHIAADEERAEWRVVFDIAVPGWLPATSIFGDDEEHGAAGVHYALYARARFLSVGSEFEETTSASPSTSTSSVWNSLCSVVRLGSSRPKSIHAEKVPILLTRYVSPPSNVRDAEDASFPHAIFAIQAIPEPESPSPTNIPADILRCIQLHAAVPSRVSVHDDSVPLVLRLRSRSEDAESISNLKILGFESEVIQVEQYHTSPSSSYTARYPLPPVAQQPPRKPLKTTHPVGSLFELGLVGAAPPHQHIVRERSILPSGASKLFRVRNADAAEGGVPFEEGWVRMEASVPVSPGLEDSNGKGKRVAGQSPFLHVKHEMRVRVTVVYEQPGCTVQSDDLGFSVPLEFVLVTPPAPSPRAPTFFPALAHVHSHSTTSLPVPHPPMDSSRRAPSRAHSLASLCSSASTSSMPSPSLPTPPPLPAYNQLFHENGDRKYDIHSELPVYREKEDSPSFAPSTTSSTPSSSSMPMTQLPPRVSSLPSPPESPISPGMPITPPGLAECRVPRRRTRCDGKFGFGESFLRFEEDDSEFEFIQHVPQRHEEDLALDGDGEVQYGIAY
ncbi:hypothetical protein K439DRAFT_1628275 [Ramaria rubella]|nr:hypothetical protein K439DRAFT_1628275 [Ramaria rubella]